MADWAVILGSSSGFGAAAARAYAKAGYGIFGAHLDRRAALPQIDELVEELRGYGVPVHFHNANAAGDNERAEAIQWMKDNGGPRSVRVLMHSLAFGTLRPYIGEGSLSRKQMEMTLDVMAHSLVYWAKDLVDNDLFGDNGRIYAMTSSGSVAMWPAYGAVSAAKCALESHIRQLAVELAPKGITANAIMAGVTPTPALDKIPGAAEIQERAIARNPAGRLTTPEDIAECMVALSAPGTHWLTGNVLQVDGGEVIAG